MDLQRSRPKTCFAIFLCLLLGVMLSGCSSKTPAKKTAAKSAIRSSASFTGTVYTVKRGDTLSAIGRMTGNSVSDLARLNKLSPPYKLLVGQRLRVQPSTGRRSSSTQQVKARPASTRNVTAASRVTPPAVGARCWLWPTKGQVIDPYSYDEGGNKGIDIAGTRGQPIYAAGPGTVVYVGNQLRGYGNLVMIKHNEEYITAYAHNETILVNTGQKVAAGQKIATMGSSGTRSVRLHFQLRYKATAIDPQRYLKPSC